MREREADPSPALQELDPKVPETGFTPLLSEGLFLCREGRPGPSVGAQRTDVSVHLSRSGESKCGREQALPPYVRLGPLLWCIQGLESSVGRLEGSVPQSFSLVRSELDEVWRDLDDY